MATAAETSSWAAHLRRQLVDQRTAQHDSFLVVDFYTELQQRHRSMLEELRNVKKDRDRLQDQLRGLEETGEQLRLAAQGLALHSAKEKELEERLAAMSSQLAAALGQTNRLLAVEHELRESKAKIEELANAKTKAETTIAQLEANLGESANTVTILRRENEALQTENAMQRQQFGKEKTENERLIPAVLNAKKIEAELQNEICELQQRLLEMSTGNPAPRGASSQREVVFRDPEAAPLSMTCVAPSYIAFCTDDAHTSEINTVTVTENGRQIWTGGSDKVLKGWDGNNGATVGRFATPASTVCLDSKASYLVAGCVDFTCRVWHLPTMRTQCQLTGHTEVVTSAYMSPDAQQVFTASRDCTIKSWDLQRGSLIHTSLCASSCYDLAVTVDRVCTAHFDNAIRLWDVRSGKMTAEVRPHEKAVTSVRVTSDGQQVVSLSRDNSICVVDLRTLDTLAKFTDPRFSISSNLARMTISPDATFCAAGCSSGDVAVFNMRDPSQKAKMLSKGHTAAVLSVCWSPEGRGLASVGMDRRVIFWR
jgi:autophagy-related protein 16